MNERILLVEDEVEITEFLAEGLKLENYQPIVTFTASEALKKLKEEKFDLLILDLSLPDMDGLELCKIIKENISLRELPILILTARSSVDEKVIGLNLGADDYITKPFSPAELIARIKALLRRARFPEVEEVISKGGITMNTRSHKVSVSMVVNVDLSPKEFELLYLLLKHSPNALSRNYLLKNLWGYSETSETRTLDVHIQRLRKKLGETIGKKIETVEGYGYRFVE